MGGRYRYIHTYTWEKRDITHQRHNTNAHLAQKVVGLGEVFGCYDDNAQNGYACLHCVLQASELRVWATRSHTQLLSRASALKLHDIRLISAAASKGTWRKMFASGRLATFAAAFFAFAIYVPGFGFRVCFGIEDLALDLLHRQPSAFPVGAHGFLA